MTLRQDLHEANRVSWNEATRAHNAHKRGQAAFLRAGGSTLFPEEVALLGNVRGQRVLHLQCNSGQDSLSLVAQGALVTGVDISDEAIAFATPQPSCPRARSSVATVSSMF
jgi:2-polyprenyl-3-methyl-5-hydroxy-6-metoxy-1,4-benzoquinol methylase